MFFAIAAGPASAGGLGTAPRPEPVAVLNVTLERPAAVADLTALGFNVTGLRGAVAEVYATEEEQRALAALGYRVSVLRYGPAVPLADSGLKALGVYHSHASLGALLAEYAADYPDICLLTSLGDSVQGRALWAIRISDHPGTDEDEPEFKYVSTMHGDEPLGTELCLYLIDHLLSGYGTDARVTQLVNETDLWIVPLMNPDGLALGTRYNASGYDLNRTFPDWPATYQDTIFDGEPLHDAGRPVEVAHVMRWTAGQSFVLSANLHTGALVVNYPYDDNGQPAGYAAAPDDALLVDVAMRYSQYNGPMWNSAVFPNGITNGADWYVIDGGMQDWNYRYAGCIEMTIELSNVKAPSAAQLPVFWDNNRESMLTYMEAAHIGARGLITDIRNGAPLWAEVRVAGNAQPVFTDPDVGDYHRMLLPGRYDLEFRAPGYVTAVVENVAIADGPATRLDVALERSCDLDGDGDVDAVDVQLVINVALGLDVEHDADFDGNGNVDAVDVQRVINRALEL